MARYCNFGAAATLLLPLLITLFITTSVPIAAESVSTAAANNHNSDSGRKCGGATECTVAGGGEEFLMDSQTATWLLNSLQDNNQKISYKGLVPPPVCDATRAGSCIAKAVNPKLNECKSLLDRSCVR